MTTPDNGHHPYSSRRPPGALGQIRIYLILIVIVLGSLLGVYIWQRDFSSYRFFVRVFAEPNLTSLADSDAEWLLPRFQFDLRLRGADEVLASIASGPEREQVSPFLVKGRSHRNAVRAGKVEGWLTYPGFTNTKLSLAPEFYEVEGDTIVYRLANGQARSFLDRRLTTFFAVNDNYGRPVTNLQSVLGIRLEERDREPGVYDVSIVVEDLLDLLERDSKYTIEVTDAQMGSFTEVLELEAKWFTRDEPGRQVIQVAVGPEGAPAQPPPAQAPPPVPDPVPAPPPAEPVRADLHVLTNPVGASVWINGARQLDRTPLHVFGLEPRRVTIRVERQGYEPQERSVTLKAGQRNAVSFALEEVRREPGSITITVSPFAEYYVDGKQIAKNVGTATVEVDPGRYDVMVDHPLFHPKVWEKVQVEAGETVTLSHAFDRAKAQGSLRVGVSRGWGQVFLDGQDTGKLAPCVLDGVMVGPHTITLMRDGAPIEGAEQRAVVREGEVTDVRFEL